MKGFLLYFIIFSIKLSFVIYNTNIKATDIELGNNVLTGHIFARSTNFKNKIDNKGILMNNPVYYLKVNNLSLIYGKDSVNSKMAGLTYSFNIKKDIDFIIGGYSHNKKDWEKLDMYNTLGSKLGFIPVIGVNIRKDIHLQDSLYLVPNLTITPSIVNLFISFKLKI